MTATSGDAVLLTETDCSNRYFIECIELNLVDPSSENGQLVAAAGERPEGGNNA